MVTEAVNGPMKPLLCALVLLTAAPAAAGDLPPGFVYLREAAPAIAQDMRYATSDNFTGRPVPGYQAAECVLRREAAAALARVAADLVPQGLALKVYDCYRPLRAVKAFWRWSQDARVGGDTRFYPHVPKRELFARGYIAARSRHSAGVAVDLTLVAFTAHQPPTVRTRESGYPELQMQTSQRAPESPLARGRTDINANVSACTAPVAQRAGDDALDMGTGFDCLDPKSFTRSAAVTPAQRRLRLLLKSAMERHGFRNYFREWWHYEFRDAPRRLYDFPIAPR